MYLWSYSVINMSQLHNELIGRSACIFLVVLAVGVSVVANGNDARSKPPPQHSINNEWAYH